MTNLQYLSALDLADRKAKKPLAATHHPEAFALHKFKDNSANSLTTAVYRWLELHNCNPRRINCGGIKRGKIKIVEDSCGFKRQIGREYWSRSGGTSGVADVESTINGKSVSWEIKYGKDRQSDAQKEYEAKQTAAGGLYFLIRTFDDFILKFNEL